MISVVLWLMQLIAPMQMTAPTAPATVANAKAAECRISGQIILIDTGEPVAGLPIALVHTTYSADGSADSAALQDSATSDEQGNYLLKGPWRAVYRVATGITAAAAQVYVPSETPLVQPSCNDELHANIAVSKGRAVKIAGKFVDGLGHRYPHMDWVWLENSRTSAFTASIPNPFRKNLSWQNALRNAAGYRIEDVLPGHYTLHGVRFDEISERAETIIPIEVRDADLNVDIVSDRSYQLNGVIRLNTGRLPLPRNTRFRLVVFPVPPTPPASAPIADASADGTFGFSSLPAGKFRIGLENVPESFYIKSARQGTVDVLKAGIIVPGKTAASLVVVIGNDGGIINGSVRTADGSNGSAKVVLIPRPAGTRRVDLYKVAYTDGSGNFQIRDVAPGDYQIYAWPREDLSGRDYFDVEFMKYFQDRGTAVRITARAEVSIELQMLR